MFSVSALLGPPLQLSAAIGALDSRRCADIRSASGSTSGRSSPTFKRSKNSRCFSPSFQHLGEEFGGAHLDLGKQVVGE